MPLLGCPRPADSQLLSRNRKCQNAAAFVKGDLNAIVEHPQTPLNTLTCMTLSEDWEAVVINRTTCFLKCRHARWTKASCADMTLQKCLPIDAAANAGKSGSVIEEQFLEPS